MTYKDAGVDIDAGDDMVRRIAPLVRKTFSPRVLDQYGSFAGLFSLDFPQELLRRNYRDPVLIACTDGVGTKLKGRVIRLFMLLVAVLFFLGGVAFMLSLPQNVGI